MLIKILSDNKNTLLLSSSVNCSLYSSDVRSVFTSWETSSKFFIVLISNKNDKDVISNIHIFGSRSGPITASSSTIIC